MVTKRKDPLTEEGEEEKVEEVEEKMSPKVNTTDNTEDILDVQEEEPIQNFLGQVLIFTHAEIDKGNEFNVIHLTAIDAEGRELKIRTTSKAIERKVNEMINNGLNNGKKFRGCVKDTMSKYKKPMYLIVSPSECEKVK
jgi:hypothetical protein